MYQTQTTLNFEDESNYVFQAIERYTLYVKQQSLRFISRWLNLTMPDTPPQLTAHDLDRYADIWAHLVPENMFIRMTVLLKLAQKYHLTYDNTANLRHILKLDSVKASFKGWHKPEGENPPDSPDLLHEVLDIFGWRRCERGEQMFAQGDEGDSLYIVIHGQLSVEITEGNTKRIVDWVGQGEIVGELALLTHTPRAATVTAIRASLLLRLSKANFERLLSTHPQMMKAIFQLMANRLRNATHKETPRAAIKAIAVIPLHDSTDFGLQLAQVLNTRRKTLYLTNYNLNAHVFDDENVALINPHDNDLVVSWLNAQEADYDFVIYEGNAKPNEWTRRCILQADYVVFVANAESNPALTEIERDLLPENVLHDLILFHPAGTERPRGTQAWREARTSGRIYHAINGEEDIARQVARRVTGHRLGVVLGGGGARCFAHVGVIRAMQERGLPIDMIGGTSAGALMGIAYAMGYPIAQILEEGQQLFHKVLDYTLPIVSLAAGKRFNDALVKQFDGVEIEDLWTEFFCVSTNLTRAQVHIHERGSARHALRASSSLPSVFPPVIAEGTNDELLIDGGILNNIPADIMHQRGADLIITVDVFSGGDPVKTAYDFDDSLSGFQLILNRLNPARKRRLNPPGMFITLLKIGSLGSQSDRQTRLTLSDVFIAPPLNDFAMFDIDKAEAIAQAGYESACEALDRWLDENPNLYAELFCTPR